jgi:hypothetical protein
MNRFIDKLIARHLEPEHNVKPLLTVMFHAAPDHAMPLMEEETVDPAVARGVGEAPGRSSSTDIREERRSVGGAVVDMRQNELDDPGREELVSPGRGADVSKETADTGPEGSERAREIVERRVEYVKKTMAYVEKERARDGIREVLPGPDPAVREGAFSQPMSLPFEGPVLQDLSKEIPMVQSGTEKEKTEVSISGVMNENNILKAFPNNASPMAPARQTIHVSIGRIEIKAMAPASETKVAPVKKDTDIMGLDRFLEQRNPAKR